MAADIVNLRAAAIARGNDALRTSLGFGPVTGGRVVMTRALAALPPADLAVILRAVATFTAFTPANDPYQEHDCATLEAAGQRVIWKIDYYENDQLEFGAEDPRTSYRVLTIMLASDY